MKPGACCSGFPLGTPIFTNGSEEEVDKALNDIVTCTDTTMTESRVVGYGDEAMLYAMSNPKNMKVKIGLPFKRAGTGRDGTWRFSCPKLGVDGRCTIYEARPAVCRQFVPGSGKPCCHYTFGIGMCSERATPPLPSAISDYQRDVERKMEGAMRKVAPLVGQLE